MRSVWLFILFLGFLQNSYSDTFELAECANFNLKSFQIADQQNESELMRLEQGLKKAIKNPAIRMGYGGIRFITARITKNMMKRKLLQHIEGSLSKQIQLAKEGQSEFLSLSLQEDQISYQALKKSMARYLEQIEDPADRRLTENYFDEALKSQFEKLKVAQANLDAYQAGEALQGEQILTEASAFTKKSIFKIRLLSAFEILSELVIAESILEMVTSARKAPEVAWALTVRNDSPQGLINIDFMKDLGIVQSFESPEWIQCAAVAHKKTTMLDAQKRLQPALERDFELGIVQDSNREFLDQLGPSSRGKEFSASDATHVARAIQGMPGLPDWAK